ncbi:MAG: DUF438 domain-containing protein [Candidatus Marinimicrobia bacterium]|jgi:hypothetical protein|nr:DUF438 domain-containing protein [Candidatus Neomarinimicrobiota bacterium]MBT3937256.1 DUF438 domain-containing protein [Candidatus Neomarinimicrobiota bacterium]MBT3960254.1 DUF438 domain-containing protein [Candidatus Neomarinimicrobiota bacterium]MBT4382272.1 DUF438 domain-containing protein [Candidatus Neomarinimicrobiota bacterium]MBT4635679.1 DUF438 domain-containing protein [Candidatus Neomarinimicrobiota bacterium]
MSELINNRQNRIEIMKTLVRQLHDGSAPSKVKSQLETMLKEADYSDVFRMEIQLIEEGVPQESIQDLCDTHTHVLRKQLDLQETPETSLGHPVHTFIQENAALTERTGLVKLLVAEIESMDNNDDALPKMREIQLQLNELMDTDKHYRRKENLIFPYFEKKGVPGVPAVMWGKDDEVRDLLKGTIAGLQGIDSIEASEAKAYNLFTVIPSVEAVDEMIYKEEKVFLPTALDLLSDVEWYEIYSQTEEIGYCLYVPEFEWMPEDIELDQLDIKSMDGKIQLPTGLFTLEEMISMFQTLPFDMTFVDKDDNVRFFSDSPERIFDRTRAILGRKVQYCHPPSSVNIVNQILEDFKSGKETQARFWINMGPKLIYIVYYALKGKNDEYLGTLEVTQDLTDIKNIEGERRILTYENAQKERK